MTRLRLMATETPTRSDALLSVLSHYPSVLIVMHDNPDPDAIASGWAVHFLIREKLGLPVRLVGGGDIVRAENREMVKLLGPPLELVEQLDESEQAAGVLVDCGPSESNHLLCASPVRPVAVIDHHQGTWRPEQLPFQDIRPRVAASATIVASYLQEQKLCPDEDLATALLYAIRTETQGGEFSHTQLDRSIIAWLSELANPERISEIENAPLPREYFADLVLALQNTFTYGDAAICFLPTAQSAEIVGEVADLLSRCDDVDRVLCAAMIGPDLVLSVRTGKDAGNAAELVRRVVRGMGHGGGHEHRAGGKIPNVGLAGQSIELVHNELRSRWREACGFSQQRGTRLVAKRDIVGNL
ncbi:MAG: DHH family phosphoesterase [Pirellulaceae bacterium]|nr:DHH family phosphoesterase [Pirellulaceae bacterium]